jgi:hypothetical protein
LAYTQHQYRQLQFVYRHQLVQLYHALLVPVLVQVPVLVLVVG